MMSRKTLKHNNATELQSTTSTDLQADVGDTDTSIYKNKQSNIELIEYKIEELSKKINELEKTVKEIKMPLIDKINKYKTTFSWAAGIISGIFGIVITIGGIWFNLYNSTIQTHFDNIEEKIVGLSDFGKELQSDIKDINKKQNSLEIKLIENKKK